MPSAALPGFYTLGVITIDNAGSSKSLIEMFPTKEIRGETVSTVIFTTHESNAAGTLIYIGDSTMTTGPNTANVSLLGPNVIYKLENNQGLNTVPLGNIKVDASVSGAKVRISVLVG